MYWKRCREVRKRGLFLHRWTRKCLGRWCLIQDITAFSRCMYSLYQPSDGSCVTPTYSQALCLCTSAAVWLSCLTAPSPWQDLSSTTSEPHCHSGGLSSQSSHQPAVSPWLKHQDEKATVYMALRDSRIKNCPRPTSPEKLCILIFAVQTSTRLLWGKSVCYTVG